MASFAGRKSEKILLFGLFGMSALLDNETGNCLVNSVRMPLKRHRLHVNDHQMLRSIFLNKKNWSSCIIMKPLEWAQQIECVR